VSRRGLCAGEEKQAEACVLLSQRVRAAVQTDRKPRPIGKTYMQGVIYQREHIYTYEKIYT
jgi:hypothetical protein